jgi:intergrase/recombinase
MGFDLRFQRSKMVQAFNLIAELGARYTEAYYNEDTQFLEHFRYPKLFLRYSKNLYVSAVPKEPLDQISESTWVVYNPIKKRLRQAGLDMRFKQLRSYYATKMREMGLLSEQIDLVQGRVGKSIFLQHYFKQDAKLLGHTILKLLPRLKEIYEKANLKVLT